MDSAAYPPSKFPAWLVANGVVVTLMVSGTALCWAADWEASKWIPQAVWEVVFWTAMAGGPIGLIVCCVGVNQVDAKIEDGRLRFIFMGMNLVGIVIGLSSFVLWFSWFVFRDHPRC